VTTALLKADHIVDRKKDMIITSGFNVYAIEVENALCAHPAVSMAAVVGIPHSDWGEAVHAEVVAQPGKTPEPSELIDHVKAEIGRYKAPKSVAFVDALPMSVVGKVLRRKVREKYWKGEQRKVG
jgi:acyl-CoA synthetase (AMP-forming)/AMP-acid ligase II